MEQILEPDSDVAGMLVISDWTLKMTAINIPRALINKVDSTTH